MSEHIRNFALIAHIDHGKSTLADGLIRLCGGLEEREMRSQVLDSMDIERERGITIKSQTARLNYLANDQCHYVLNLLDTPGHVDFSYEVSRSLAACEGSLLIVDASQGVEAQTLANAYKAIAAGHEIIPVLNKIDLASADPDRALTEIAEAIGLAPQEALAVSAKEGCGLKAVMDRIIERLPPPVGQPEAPLKALLVDSWYDNYLGVVVLVRVFNGTIRPGMSLQFLGTGVQHIVDHVGIFTPKRRNVDALHVGEIGFFTASIKRVADCRVGDTITETYRQTPTILPGFSPAQPVVFCGLFPQDSSDFPRLRSALDKLALNDSSLFFEAESSAVLGLGFRCGFLGLLHLEITCERLEREFQLELVITAPGVLYRLHARDGSTVELRNPEHFPSPHKLNFAEEPWIRADIVLPEAYLGGVIGLCHSRRGEQKLISVNLGRARLEYHLPLSEVVTDFHDRLKSISRGYASLDYEIDGYRQADIVKLDILINGEPAAALASIQLRSLAETRGRAICERLKSLVPRQLYKVTIQAAIGGRVLARETVSALRKDVTAKCYGGDVTRKRKLLEKQKEGKKRMQRVGRVDIPKSAFIAALRPDEHS